MDREKIAKEIAKITMYWQHEGDIDELAIADWHIAEIEKAKIEGREKILGIIRECSVAASFQTIGQYRTMLIDEIINQNTNG